MRLGVITTSYPRHPGDFAGGFVEAGVRELLAQGHSVDVIAAGDSAVGASLGGASQRQQPSSLLLLLETPRLRVARVARPSGGGGPPLFYGQGAPEALEAGGAHLWLEAAAFCAGLSQQIRANVGAWDEVHAHWLVPSALVACSVAGGTSGIVVRAHAHSGDVALLERLPGGRMLARWLASRLTEIAFVSTDLERRFARLVGGPIAARCRIAPAARDPRPSLASTPSSMLVEAVRSPRTILSVGRLVPIKGFDVLLKAVALHEAVGLHEADGPGAHVRSPRGAPRGPRLVILGDGPERARLTRLARRLDLEIELPGFVPRDDVSRWMRTADLYVQPSRRLANGRTEGFPVATLEALDHGLPVLASDCGGLAELPAHSSGAPGASRARLFPEGDYRALARLLS